MYIVVELFELKVLDGKWEVEFLEFSANWGKGGSTKAGPACACCLTHILRNFYCMDFNSRADLCFEVSAPEVLSR